MLGHCELGAEPCAGFPPLSASVISGVWTAEAPLSGAWQEEPSYD